MTLVLIDPAGLPHPVRPTPRSSPRLARLVFVAGQVAGRRPGSPCRFGRRGYPGPPGIRQRRPRPGRRRSRAGPGHQDHDLRRSPPAEYLADISEALIATFGDHMPTDTLVGVEALAEPKHLIEVEAIAGRRSGRAPPRCRPRPLPRWPRCLHGSSAHPPCPIDVTGGAKCPTAPEQARLRAWDRASDVAAARLPAPTVHRDVARGRSKARWCRFGTRHPSAGHDHEAPSARRQRQRDRDRRRWGRARSSWRPGPRSAGGLRVPAPVSGPLARRGAPRSSRPPRSRSGSDRWHRRAAALVFRARGMRVARCS